jgi:hypothetical protein
LAWVGNVTSIVSGIVQPPWAMVLGPALATPCLSPQPACCQIRCWPATFDALCRPRCFVARLSAGPRLGRRGCLME